MTSIRQEFLAAKFNEWLDRFSPPRRMANDTAAQQQDANAMLQTVMRFAPKEDYGDWLPAMLRRLEDGMTTRSWPAPGEVVKACKAGGSGSPDVNKEVQESAALDRMVDWFGKFKTQMPGHGHYSRTQKLIERGVIKDLREARYRGFDITFEQSKEAKEQPVGTDEKVHHQMVLNDLLNTQERNAARRDEIMRGKEEFAHGATDDFQ